MKVPYNYLPQQFPADHRADETTITEKILMRIWSVVERGDFTLGTEVGDFERAWSRVVGSKHAIGVSNGTDAIALALEAAGLQRGEEVVTSPVSFVATVGGIMQAGGEPVFVDVAGTDRPNIVPADVPVGDVKYFVLVLWAGSPFGVKAWDGIHTPSYAPKPHRLNIILDAAQGINAKSYHRRIGILDGITAATYSLHPLKNINVWGDGGMIVTNDMGLDHELRSLRNHGLVGRDIWERPGYNHRLSTLQAAVGLEVLETFDMMNDNRQRNAAVLTKGISEINGITPPYVADGDTHGWHLYQIIVEDRDDCVRYLNDHGIEAKVHYPVPLHLQPAVRGLGYARGDFPNAEAFCDSNVTLPINEYLTIEQMEYMVKTLEAWAKAGA